VNVSVLGLFYVGSRTLKSVPFQGLKAKKEEYLSAHQEFVATGKARIIDAAFAYYFPFDDFVNDSLGVEAAQAVLRDGVIHEP
jgi:hypothetical protein